MWSISSFLSIDTFKRVFAKQSTRTQCCSVPLFTPYVIIASQPSGEGRTITRDIILQNSAAESGILFEITKIKYPPMHRPIMPTLMTSCYPHNSLPAVENLSSESAQSLWLSESMIFLRFLFVGTFLQSSRWIPRLRRKGTANEVDRRRISFFLDLFPHAPWRPLLLTNRCGY